MACGDRPHREEGLALGLGEKSLRVDYNRQIFTRQRHPLGSSRAPVPWILVANFFFLQHSKIHLLGADGASRSATRESHTEAPRRRGVNPFVCIWAGDEGSSGFHPRLILTPLGRRMERVALPAKT